MASKNFHGSVGYDESVPAAQQVFEEHERTYRGFLQLAMWFVVHIALILIGLYFVTLQDALYFGGMFWLLAIVLMGYGAMKAALRSTPRH